VFAKKSINIITGKIALSSFEIVQVNMQKTILPQFRQRQIPSVPFTESYLLIKELRYKFYIYIKSGEERNFTLL